MDKLKTLLGVSILLFGSVSQAALITYDDTININQTSINTTSFDIMGFDSALGDLTEIVFNLDLTISGDTTFNNTTSNSGIFERSLLGGVQVKGLNFILSGSAQTDTEILPVSANGTVTAFMGPASDSAAGNSTDASILSSFIDPVGDIKSISANFIINAGGTISGDNGANFTGNITNFYQLLSSTLSVSYVYDEAVSVPEPSIIALFGAGLLGIGIVRRRRLKR